MAKPKIDILYPGMHKDGTKIIVAGTRILAFGCGPKKAGGVKGKLLQNNNIVAGPVVGQGYPPPHPLCHSWFILFTDLSQVQDGDVILQVEASQGTDVDSGACTFTFNKLTPSAPAAKRTKKAKLTTAADPPITPDPPLGGTTVPGTFYSTGDYAGDPPLYAHIQQDGGQPYFGVLTQNPPSTFVFQFSNVPAGSGYTIYYMDTLNDTSEDHNITVS